MEWENRQKYHHHSGFTTEGTYDPLLLFKMTDIKKNHTVLDAGSGTGYLSMIASRMIGDGGKVYSFDIHKDGIDILKMRIEHGGFNNIDARVLDITEPLPVDDNEIDLAIFSNVLHGFIFNEEIDPVLKNIERTVKPGGQVAIVEFLKEETEFGPPVDERFSPEEIEKVMKPAGLEMKDNSRISDNHYLAVFQKV